MILFESASHVTFFQEKPKRAAMSLQYSMVEQPFSQWGLDVIVPINTKSNKGHSYTITAIDYFTKWQEATALRN